MQQEIVKLTKLAPDSVSKGILEEISRKYQAETIAEAVELMGQMEKLARHFETLKWEDSARRDALNCMTKMTTVFLEEKVLPILPNPDQLAELEAANATPMDEIAD